MKKKNFIFPNFSVNKMSKIFKEGKFILVKM